MIDALRIPESEDVTLNDEYFGYSLNHTTDIDNKTKLNEVLNFMKTLTEREQTILTLRIWDDLSYDEISFITGESVVNTKQIVSRSLAKIAANVSYIIFLTFIISNANHY